MITGLVRWFRSAQQQKPRMREPELCDNCKVDEHGIGTDQPCECRCHPPEGNE